MGAALIRPLTIGLLPIIRSAAAAAERDFSNSFQFQFVAKVYRSQ